MKAGNFTLSDKFIMNSPRGLVNLQELVILYELKSAIIEQTEVYAFHLATMKEIHEDLHIVEEAIQEAFGFEANRDYHRFWEWPYCECPHLDNSDNWGTKFHYYSGSCPIHRDKITQENWKEHFFNAVEESVAHAKTPIQQTDIVVKLAERLRKLEDKVEMIYIEFIKETLK